MKQLIILSVLLNLAACGGGADPVDYTYDEKLSTGITIRYDADGVSPETVKKTLETVKSCMGVDTKIDVLIVFSPESRDPLVESGGRIDYIENGKDVITIYKMQPYYSKLILSHEFVHAILASSGDHSPNNSNHESPYFASCSYIGN